MLDRFLRLFGTRSSRTEARPPYQPYKQPGFNVVYNLLFCDDFALFKKNEAPPPASPLAVLFADPPDRDALDKLANDLDAESRYRVLAYRRLQASGFSVPSKRLLGVIVENRQPQGLDTLAAFVDGRMRYINQAEKYVVFESTPGELEASFSELIRVSQLAVNRIGPWNRPRLPPPSGDLFRMTFLVSDGLYFGQGSAAVMAKEEIGGPVYRAASLLLPALVDYALTSGKTQSIKAN